MNRASRRLLAAVADAAPAGVAYATVERLAPALLRAKGKRLRRDTRTIFPDRDPGWIAGVAHRQQVHRGWVALDKFVLPRVPDRELVDCVDPTDIGILRAVTDSALASGKGCIAVSLHYGRPIVGARLFPVLGYPCTVVHNGMEKLLHAVAAGPAPDVEFVGAGDAACALRVIRALARNRIVFVLLDGGIARRWRTIGFLGQRVSVPEAVPRLAQVSGASIVAGVVASDGALGFRIRYRRVERPAGGCELQGLAEAMMEPFSEPVLADPGQWYGINRVFRYAGSGSTPDGEPAASIPVQTAIRASRRPNDAPRGPVDGRRP